MNFHISVGGGRSNGGGGGYYGGQTAHPPPQAQGQQHMQMQQPSPHYGGYQHAHQANVFGAAAWQAMNFTSADDFFLVFEKYKNHALNGLQGQELHAILNNHPQIKAYYGIIWGLELCKIMLAMMDRNKNGIMQYEEFLELLNCLVYWKNTFQQYDADRTGYIEAEEMYKCISTKFGYQLSQKSMETLLKRYSRVHNGRCLIAFDDFVAMSVRLRAYTEAFRARDRQCHGGQETGDTMFGYDDFVQCVMCL